MDTEKKILDAALAVLERAAELLASSPLRGANRREPLPPVPEGALAPKQVSTQIGCPIHWLYAAIKTGAVPIPAHVRGKRLYFDPSQIDAVRAAYMTSPIPLTQTERVSKVFAAFTEQGYYTLKEAAKRVPMPISTLQRWIFAGKLPAPARQAPGYSIRLYNDDDIAEIRRLLKTQGYKALARWDKP